MGDLERKAMDIDRSNYLTIFLFHYLTHSTHSHLGRRWQTLLTHYSALFCIIKNQFSLFFPSDISQQHQSRTRTTKRIKVRDLWLSTTKGSVCEREREDWKERKPISQFYVAFSSFTATTTTTTSTVTRFKLESSSSSSLANAEHRLGASLLPQVGKETYRGWERSKRETRKSKSSANSCSIQAGDLLPCVFLCVFHFLVACVFTCVFQLSLSLSLS